MRPVIVTVDAEQQTGEDTVHVLVRASGRYGYRAGKVLLSYEESESFGVPVKTILQVDETGRVILLRSGGTEHRLEIETGRRHDCLYQTDQGTFTLGITGITAESRWHEAGGSMTVCYSLEWGDGASHLNTLTITVKEV